MTFATEFDWRLSLALTATVQNRGHARGGDESSRGFNSGDMSSGGLGSCTRWRLAKLPHGVGRQHIRFVGVRTRAGASPSSLASEARERRASLCEPASLPTLIGCAVPISAVDEVSENLSADSRARASRETPVMPTLGLPDMRIVFH